VAYPFLPFLLVNPQHLTTIGAGYVGLVTAVGLTRLGHQVDLVEIDPRRRDVLASGRVPIHEPGLNEAYGEAVAAGRLRVVERPEPTAEMVLVCVGTPINQEGRSDLSQLESAVSGIGRRVSPDVTLVIRSTLPPGATRLALEWSGLAASQLFTNPEFLRQGSALADFLHPSRIVIGRFRDADGDRLRRVWSLYDGVDAPRIEVDVAAAELIKNGSNAFLALKLSFVTELASLSEEYGADVGDVLNGISADPRIGGVYMRPSFGFGGSCLPKELRALAAAGIARGLPMHVTTAASSANASSQQRFAARIASLLDGVQGRTIGLLGLAFKADTDDVRDSPALALAETLLASGARVQAFDPRASARAAEALPELRIAADAAEAAQDADALVVATEWPQFADLDWSSLVGVMRRRLVIDGKRLLDPAQMRALDIEYESIGSPGAVRSPALRPVGPGRERREAGSPSAAALSSSAGSPQAG
jgi:UDPglucose 6-dehydrogenase